MTTGRTERHGKAIGGRPPLDEAVKRLRATLKPCRTRRPAPGVVPVERPPVPRDYVAVARQYAADVVGGRIVAGVWTRKACQRFQRFLARAADPACPFTFSADHAASVCRFVERLPHVEGDWPSPTIQLEPWQVFILVWCYGFRIRATGRRLVTVVYFEVGRKSAKSTLVAAAALFHLLVEQEAGSQVVLAATTGAQARIVFGIMQRMVRKSAWLREQGLRVFANAITHEAIGAAAKPINSKSSTQDGLNPSFISLDESHAQTFELRDVLVSAMGARPDGMIWCPTTAGYDMTSVGYALRGHATKILDAVVESDHSFVIMYELDEGDRWDDERMWIKSCPMIGVTPTREYVQRYCQDAQQAPGLQGEFETKVCNRWLHASSMWLSMAAWDRCADPTMRLEDFAGEAAWIGADLAQRDDFAALAIVFLRDGLLYAFVHLYLPELVVQERSRAVPEYARWAKSPAILTLTDGNLIDFNVVEAEIRALCRAFQVKDICFDQFGSVQISSRLATDGLPARIEAKNAKTFTAPARELEVRVKAGKFRHDGNSALRWMASNCCVSRRIDDSILPKKDGPESPNKIDGIDAVITAIGGFLRQPVVPERNFQMYVLGGTR